MRKKSFAALWLVSNTSAWLSTVDESPVARFATQENPATSFQARLDDFQHSRHPDRISAEILQYSGLSRGFVLRTNDSGVDALVQKHTDLVRGIAKMFLQSR